MTRKSIPLVASDVVERADVRMVQRRRWPALRARTCPGVRLPRQVIGQDLDGHRSIEPRVAGPIDLAHPTGADERDDLVVAQAGAGSQGHGGFRVIATGTRLRVARVSLCE